MKRTVQLILLSLIISTSALAETQLRIVTENYPPMNYYENGEVKGIAPDIIKLVLKEMNIKADMEVLPWARAYNIALKEPNVLIFAISRSDDREKLFKWGEPIIMNRGVLISKKSRQIKINSLSDLKGYRVGVVKEDIHEQTLKKAKIKGLIIDSVSKQELNLYKLKIDRIDLWGCSENVAKWIIHQEKGSISDYVNSYTLFNSYGYYAFSRNTSDETVEVFNSSFRKLKRKGKLDQIIKEYLGE